MVRTRAAAVVVPLLTAFGAGQLTSCATANMAATAGPRGGSGAGGG